MAVPASQKLNAGSGRLIADYRQAFRLAMPAVIENLLTSMVLLVDALMVASLGPASLAAVGLSSVLLWRLRSLVSVSQVGTSATVARRWGEGNEGAAGVLLAHTTVVGLFLGSICLLLWPFVGGIFTMLNADDVVQPLATSYCQIILLSFPFRIAATNMAAAFRAAGDTRTPMFTNLMINIVNIFLNWLLIFGNLGFPKLGIFGAGLSTAIAFVLEFLVYYTISRRGIMLRRSAIRDSAKKPEKTLLRYSSKGWRLYIPLVTPSIFRISHATFWEECAVTVGFLGFISMIAGFGADALAAHTSVTRIESFSFMAGFGVSIAAATLVGQALGSGIAGRARQIFAVTLTMGVTFMGLMGLAFACSPSFFLSWFTRAGSENFNALATMIFLIVALEQPLIGAGQVLAAGLRGAGLTSAPFLSQLLGTVGIRIGVGYLLAFPLGFGLEGIYWATLLDWLLRTLVLGYIALGNRWERVSL